MIRLLLLCVLLCLVVSIPSSGSSNHSTTSNKGITHIGPKQTWHTLATVDGLKNEEVVILVTSSAMKNADYLSQRIIPSARTWMKSFAHVFILLEDTFFLRFTLRHCVEHAFETYTVFVCHQEPSYLLIHDCTSSEYGALGPCCKLDGGLQFVWKDLPTLYSVDVKFVLHTNDVTFVRPDQFLRYLAAINHIGLDDIPLIGNPFRSDSKHVLRHVWHVEGCDEIRTSGWYQPLVLNHAALEKLQRVTHQNGLTATCRNFDLNVDIAMEIIAWMLAFNHFFVPHVELNEGFQGKSILDGSLMMVSNINHDRADFCSSGNEDRWPTRLRYNQDVVVGCGDVNTSSPFHDANRLLDMYDVNKYFQQHGKPLQYGKLSQDDWIEMKVEKYMAVDGKFRIKRVLPLSKGSSRNDSNEMITKVIMPKLTPLRGYTLSKHAQLYHHEVATSWHEMKLSDCKHPGKVLFPGEAFMEQKGNHFLMKWEEIWTTYGMWIVLVVMMVLISALVRHVMSLGGFYNTSNTNNQYV